MGWVKYQASYLIVLFVDQNRIRENIFSIRLFSVKRQQVTIAPCHFTSFCIIWTRKRKRLSNNYARKLCNDFFREIAAVNIQVPKRSHRIKQNGKTEIESLKIPLWRNFIFRVAIKKREVTTSPWETTTSSSHWGQYHDLYPDSQRGARDYNPGYARGRLWHQGTKEKEEIKKLEGSNAN